MARKTIFVSDLTGREIDEKDAVTVTIKYSDARKGQVVLDVNASEVAALASKGTKQARRGRKPKEVVVPEVSSGSKPIEGVGTATVGRSTSQSALGKPKAAR
jgi:hypothetical protein